MTDLILYTTEDGRSRIKLRADRQAVWLTQFEMAELFDATKQNISLQEILDNCRGILGRSESMTEHDPKQLGERTATLAACR